MTRRLLPQIDPVVIMLDGVGATGALSFSGVDLEDGSRVSVTVTRAPEGPPPVLSHEAQSGILLVLSIETLARH